MFGNYVYCENIKAAICCLLEHSLSRHSRIMVVRFDIRFPNGYSGDTSNTPISRCMARITQTFTRKNIYSCYIWVREQKRSIYPHFHCAMLVDGHKSQSPYSVLNVANEQWKNVVQCEHDGLTHYCMKAYDGTPQANGIMIRKDKEDYNEKINESLNQLLYLAKSADKGTPLDGVRDFGMSRLA